MISEENIAILELAKQKEDDYLLTIKTIKEHLITWPADVDSKRWNERLNNLIHHITEKFGYDGENE